MCHVLNINVHSHHRFTHTNAHVTNFKRFTLALFTYLSPTHASTHTNARLTNLCTPHELKHSVELHISHTRLSHILISRKLPPTHANSLLCSAHAHECYCWRR